MHDTYLGRETALASYLAAWSAFASTANNPAPTLSDDDRAMYDGSDEDLRAWVDDCEARVGLDVTAWRAATETFIARRAEELAWIRAEFREYDGQALALDGFECNPWHNDMAPKYLHHMPACAAAGARDPYLVLWADFVADDQREHEGPRFILQYCPDSYCSEFEHEVEGETLADIVAKVDAHHLARFGVTLPADVPLWRRAQAAFAPAFAVGVEFLRVLGEWLDEDEFATACLGDLTEAHDYCDANMAVAEAFERVIGCECIPSNDEHTAIFNAAWDVARACR